MRDRDPEPAAGPFQVHLADNYACFDEGIAAPGPSFARYEDAVAWCRRRVEASVARCFEPGMDAEALFARYRALGEDPWVLPEPAGRHFSARELAREAAARLSAARDAAR